MEKDMGKVIWKPSTLMAPVPAVLVSCGTVDKPNAFTVAWTGIVNSDPAMTYISVRPERHSYKIIRDSGEFVINLVPRSLVRAADFCGVRTGAKIDKFKKMKMTAESSCTVNAPTIVESPVSLECKVVERKPLGTHDMFLAEITAVVIDEQYIDENGKLRLDKARLTAYCHGEYFDLGKKLGSFGYSVKKKKK
jgi:flavin reductase (DIM6/NTAB) family NADH-FMN oxidoreductase RutF